MNTWLLVPAEEVGLLARLRPAVRRTPQGVLVALDSPPPVTGAQLGLGVEGTLLWYGGGFTATEVHALVEHVRLGRLHELGAVLAHRHLPTRPTRRLTRRDGGASPRTCDGRRARGPRPSST
ncbi:hypothetical protein AB2L27_18635 [Kineococcus sp. LSe6-4]|uniref:Uncharacterized protein n=1 Tax=Kineococcus halophytocola TaxID=3234027 RepID=A0ABV4H7K9_9ACTN